MLFANGSFTAPGGLVPTALVRWGKCCVRWQSDEDLDGGAFLQPVRSPEDIDQNRLTSIKQQQPDFIKLRSSIPRIASRACRGWHSDCHGLDPSLTPYLVGKAHGDCLQRRHTWRCTYDFDVAVAARAY